MPNIKSAKKRVRGSAKKAEYNKATRTALKTQIKKADEAIAENTSEKDDILRKTVKKIDQAAAKGLLQKNTAARKKSALVKRANA